MQQRIQNGAVQLCCSSAGKSGPIISSRCNADGWWRARGKGDNGTRFASEGSGDAGKQYKKALLPRVLEEDNEKKKRTYRLAAMSGESSASSDGSVSGDRSTSDAPSPGCPEGVAATPVRLLEPSMMLHGSPSTTPAAGFFLSSSIDAVAVELFELFLLLLRRSILNDPGSVVMSNKRTERGHCHQ